MLKRILWAQIAATAIVAQAATLCWAQTAAQTTTSAPSAVSTIDDKAPAWIWDHMTPCDSVTAPLSSAHAGGPGSSGTYIFSGTGVSIYGLSAHTVQVSNVTHRTTKLRVTIDGVPKGEFAEYIAGQLPSTPICVIHNLPDGNHSLILEPVAGWAGVSSLSIEHSASTAGAAAITSSFFTNFKSGDTKAWTAYGGSWTLDGQWYVGSAENGNKTILSGSQFSNFTFNTDLVVSGTGDAGVIFRVTSPDVGTDAYNGYYVGLDTAKQAVVIGKAAGDWTVLTTQPYPVQSGSAYHLRVVAQGNVISAYVQGKYICSVNDPSYSTGAIGLRTFGVVGAFTNVGATKTSN